MIACSVLSFSQAYHSVPLHLTDIMARLSFFPVYKPRNSLVEDFIRGGRSSQPIPRPLNPPTTHLKLYHARPPLYNPSESSNGTRAQQSISKHWRYDHDIDIDIHPPALSSHILVSPPRRQKAHRFQLYLYLERFSFSFSLNLYDKEYDTGNDPA
jgi:hypothetical protein